MTVNDVNNTYNIEAREELSERDDSINETHNEGDETTPIQEGQYHWHVREPTPYDAEEEHVMEIVEILRERQKEIMKHLSRLDRLLIELEEVLSCASNNVNGRGSVPPSVPTNQMAQRFDNTTPRVKVSFDKVGGTDISSGNNNANDPFKT